MNMLRPSWIIAKNTYREIIRDRLLYGIFLIAALVTASSFFMGTVSLGQDSRVLHNIGLASIHLFAFFICAFVATNSISKDFERRTLYFLFPKPIQRQHYIFGKFLGLVLLLITTLLILGVLFSLGSLLVDRSLLGATAANLGYSFLEISLLTAIAILFASFTAPLNAFLYTLALFIIGHGLPTVRGYVEATDFPVLKGIIRVAYYVFPNLEKFNVRAATLYDVPISGTQLLWTILYWAVFLVLTLYLAVLVMRKREV